MREINIQERKGVERKRINNSKLMISWVLGNEEIDILTNKSGKRMLHMVQVDK